MENRLNMAASSRLSDTQRAAPNDALRDASMSQDDDLLTRLVGYFQESEDVSREARERSERCRDYYSNIQYTAAELATLKQRGQAPTYVNYIQRKVDTVCGIERRSRADPKAFPRNPSDERLAEAATDALRYVADSVKFDALRSKVFEDILVEGTGAAEVLVVQSASGDYQIDVKRIPWDRFWWDPHSRELDFGDAKYKGIVIWMDAADAKAKWPGSDDFIDNTLRNGYSQTFDDRPRHLWCDSKRKRVRIVQCHYTESDGHWWMATFTKGGFLEPAQASPYMGPDGESACSIIARSGYVDRENNRYGHCEGLIPLQDEINKRRSKALHLMSQRQTYGNKTAIVDTKKAKTELAKPDGHVELNGGAVFGQDFGTLPTGDMAAAQFQMLQQALGEMNATGANSALSGKDNAAPSGIALQTKIQAGATELEPQTDGLREWAHQVYEAMWLRVRQFWTGEKWIRVTDDDRNLKWVGLNKPVTLQDKLAQLQPAERMQVMQGMQLQPGDPRLQQVIEVENDVSGLAVDIVLEEGPDMATLQSEQFQLLAQLAGSPVMQGQIPATALIRASSLRNKDQLLEEIEKHQAGQAQAGQAAQQTQMAGAQAELRKTQSEAAKNEASAEKTSVDATIAAQQAMLLAPQMQVQQLSQLAPQMNPQPAQQSGPPGGPPPMQPPQPPTPLQQPQPVPVMQ